MSFQDDVLDLLAYLPPEVAWSDLVPFLPWLHRKHPEAPGAERRLELLLRSLVEGGVLELVGERRWRLANRERPRAAPDLGLEGGDKTSRDELADLLGLKGPAPLRRGMFKAAAGPFRTHLLLFHDPYENPYGDVVGSTKIHYVGQGQTGDQELNSFNRYLADHLHEGITVHFFEKEDERGTLRYRGEVLCERVQRLYREEERRSVLAFDLIPVDHLFIEEGGPPTEYYRKAVQGVRAFPGQPRLVERARLPTLAQRVVRDIAFRDVIFEAYDRQCAVCGVPLARGDLTELQAAHIVGVAERGPDDPRNGLSLCVRHHWAFDNGVFTLADNLALKPLVVGTDPHGEIHPGEVIFAPETPELRPHPWYVAHHRIKWTSPVPL